MQRGDLMLSTPKGQAPQRGPALDPLAYTLPEAARVSGLSVATLRRHEKAGRLRFYKVGGRTLVAAGSLSALLTGDTM
jgi:excisionase family DNA binding protein